MFLRGNLLFVVFFFETIVHHHLLLRRVVAELPVRRRAVADPASKVAARKRDKEKQHIAGQGRPRTGQYRVDNLLGRGRIDLFERPDGFFQPRPPFGQDHGRPPGMDAGLFPG